MSKELTIQKSSTNAERTFKDAKNKYWYLPDTTISNASRHCINAIVGLLVPGNAFHKLIATLILGLKDIGIEMLKAFPVLGCKMGKVKMIASFFFFLAIKIYFKEKPF